MPSLRFERVRELLKRQIGEIVRREFPSTETGLISVSDLQLAGDLKSATVFVGVLGSPAQQQRAVESLERERVRIQDLVGRAVVLKHTPRLRFELDHSVERGDRVLAILEDLERSGPTP